MFGGDGLTQSSQLLRRASLSGVSGKFRTFFCFSPCFCFLFLLPPLLPLPLLLLVHFLPFFFLRLLLLFAFCFFQLFCFAFSFFCFSVCFCFLTLFLFFLLLIPLTLRLGRTLPTFLAQTPIPSCLYFLFNNFSYTFQWAAPVNLRT